MFYFLKVRLSKKKKKKKIRSIKRRAFPKGNLNIDFSKLFMETDDI